MEEFDKENFLSETARAEASLYVIESLHYSVQYHYNKLEKGERKRRTFENPLAEYLSKTITKYMPESIFWEEDLVGILNDMINFEFNKEKSLNRNAKRLSPIIGKIVKTNVQLECFENISLLEHTVNVVKKVEELANEERYLHKKVRVFDVMMGALLHDFGKSFKLVRTYFDMNIFESDIKHEDFSGLYIDLKIEKTSNFLMFRGMKGVIYEKEMEHFKMIKEAVVNHHKKEFEEENLSYFVQEADKKAREDEWARYLATVEKK